MGKGSEKQPKSRPKSLKSQQLAAERRGKEKRAPSPGNDEELPDSGHLKEPKEAFKEPKEARSKSTQKRGPPRCPHPSNATKSDLAKPKPEVSPLLPLMVPPTPHQSEVTKASKASKVDRKNAPSVSPVVKVFKSNKSKKERAKETQAPAPELPDRKDQTDSDDEDSTESKKPGKNQSHGHKSPHSRRPQSKEKKSKKEKRSKNSMKDAKPKKVSKPNKAKKVDTRFEADEVVSVVAEAMPPGTGKKVQKEGKENGVQCTGRELMERFGKENGVQLGRLQGKQLGPPEDKSKEANESKATELPRPPPTYKCIKLLAEILEVMANLESNGAGSETDVHKRLCLKILGQINHFWIPATKHMVLEAGKVERGLDRVPPKEMEKMTADVTQLPATSEARKTIETAIKKSRLLNLSQLSEVMHELGFQFETTDAALGPVIKLLSEPGNETSSFPVVAPEDATQYIDLILNMKEKNATRNHFLVFGPQLAEEHAEEAKGVVCLKRYSRAGFGAVLPPAANFSSIKVTAILFDVLYRIKGILSRLPGPDSRFQLGCLGGVNRTFMCPSQRSAIMTGRHTILDNADLDVFKDVSVAARHASIADPKKLSNGAKKIQKHILENRTFNLSELVDLFVNLAHRLYIPYPVYRSLLNELTRLKMITKDDSSELCSRVGSDEQRKGVHIFNVVPLIAPRVELTDHYMKPRSGYVEAGFTPSISGPVPRKASAESAASNVESGQSSSRSNLESEAESDLESESEAKSGRSARPGVVPVGFPSEEKPPSLPEVAQLLLEELFTVRKMGIRHVLFAERPYARLQAFFERNAPTGMDKKKRELVLGLCRTAIQIKTPLSVQELQSVVELLPSYYLFGPDELKALLATLRAKGFLRPDQEAAVIRSTALPVTLTALRLILFNHIPPKAPSLRLP